MRHLGLAVLTAVFAVTWAGMSIASEQTEATKTTVEKAEKMDMKTENPVVVLETTLGQISIELYPAKAPITVENFLAYVREGFYDGLIFHRVIGNFMVQGGGFAPDMTQKQTKGPIKNEAGNGLKNKRGTIAMARTQVLDSATSQFFINVVDNASLDHRNETDGFGYCVFGKVIAGMDAVDKIRDVKTATKGQHQNVPVEPVLIQKAYVKGEEKMKASASCVTPGATPCCAAKTATETKGAEKIDGKKK